MNKVAKVIVYIIGGIIVIVALVVVVIVAGYIINEAKARNEKYEITNGAIVYIRDKYKVTENEITLLHTNLYGEHERCMFSCWDNTSDVKFTDKECLITYHMEKKYYSDDCQAEEIRTGFENHLKKKYNFLTEIKAVTDEAGTPIKYDNDIDDYFKNINEFNNTKDEIKNYGISAEIWIKADNNNQAKDIYQKKIKGLIVYLESLGLDYSVSISRASNEHMYYAFYYINAHEKEFSVLDKVDTKNFEGPRSDYKDGSFIK